MNVSGTTVSATGHKGGLGDGLYDKAGARPDLDLDFARTKSLKDRVSKEDLITFTRSTSGTGNGSTYVDENGLVKKPPVNLLYNSNSISQEVTGGTIHKWRRYLSQDTAFAGTGTAPTLTIEANYAIAPDGTKTAARCEFASGTQENNITLLEQGFSGSSNRTVPSGAGTILSVYLKSTDGSNQTLNISNQGSTRRTITVTGEWQRFELVSNRDAANQKFRIGIRTGDNSSYLNYLPTGSSFPNIERDVLVWGAQVELNNSNLSTGLVTGAASALIKTTDQASGAPRFTHDPETLESKGLLIEQESINYITYSEDFTQGWTDFGTTGAGISLTRTNDASVTNPSGTAGATKVVVTRTNHTNQFRAIRHPAISRGVTDQSTVSFWIKAATTLDVGKSVSVWQHDDGNFRLDVKLTLTNDWVRHIFTASSTNGHINEPLNIGLVQSTTAAGSNNTEMSVGYYVWGAQFENGTLGTSYIPTSGSTVTRSPDLASIEGDNFGTYRTNIATNTSFRKNFDDYTRFLSNTRYNSYAAISPSGKFDAAKLTAISTGTNTNHRLDQNLSLEGSVKYSISVYAKAGTTTRARIALQDQQLIAEQNQPGSYSVVDFNLDTANGATPSITGSPTLDNKSITHVGNDWYLIKYTSDTTVATPSGDKIMLQLADSTGSISFDGNGETMFFWGLQVERADSPTELIPSTDEFDNRQSNARYVDGNGIIRTSYANRLKYSEQLDQAVWVKSGGSSITANNVVAPDGTTTADTWSLDSTRYGFYNNTANSWMSAHSQLLYPFTITDEWVRYSIPFSTESGQTSMRVYPLRTNNNVAFVYQTDITVVPSTNYVFSAWYKKVGTKVYVWGCQLVKGSEAGDYYKTTDTISGPPRYSYDPDTLTPTGLYLEPQATNILPYSENFTHTDWDKDQTTVTANATTAPDGTNTATLAFADHSHGQGSHRVRDGGNNLGPYQYTFSVFVKANTTNSIGLNMFKTNVSTILNKKFNLDTGTLVSGGAGDGKITKYPNGWYRIEGTSIPDTNTANTSAVIILYENNGTDLNYTVPDDGSTVSVYLWGAQLEQSLSSTSYIKTTGQTNGATRSADIFDSTATEVLNRANGTKPAFYTPDGISIYAEAKYNAASHTNIANFSRILQLRKNSDNVVGLYKYNNQIQFIGPNNMFVQRGYNSGSKDLQIGTRYAKNDSRIYLNDNNLITNRQGTLDTIVAAEEKATDLYIGNNAIGSGFTNGTIKRLTFWKTPLPDSNLDRLTS